MRRDKPSTLVVTDSDAIARASTRSDARVAKVLGREVREGIETIWLDRLLHEPNEEFEGWVVGGAISTVLRRQVEIAR